MANKTENNGSEKAVMSSMFGDMTLLREIIMGPKTVEYAQQFSDLEALIERNEVANNQRLETLEKDMHARFDKLEEILKQNVAHLHQKLETTSSSDKNQLAELLIELSTRLKS
jgi:uncharacterized phage infection (PIP) family protein YhgE